MEVSGIAEPLKGQKDIKKEPRKIQGNFTVDFRGHVETFLRSMRCEGGYFLSSSGTSGSQFTPLEAAPAPNTAIFSTTKAIIDQKLIKFLTSFLYHLSLRAFAT